MPNLPITGLPTVISPNPTDPFAIVNGGVTKQIAMQDVSTTVFNNISSSVVLPNQTGSFVTSYYLSAYHTGTLTVPAINTPYTTSFSSTDFSRGITISGSYSDKIKVSSAGIYNIQFSAQVDKVNSSNANVFFWLSKNGTAIPWTNTDIAIFGGANEAAVAAWNFFVSASANDYFQLMFGANNDNIVIESTTPTIGPEIPALILTVNRVG
jgi:hypothetical protein